VDGLQKTEGGKREKGKCQGWGGRNQGGAGETKGGEENDVVKKRKKLEKRLVFGRTKGK